MLRGHGPGRTTDPCTWILLTDIWRPGPSRTNWTGPFQPGRTAHMFLQDEPFARKVRWDMAYRSAAPKSVARGGAGNV